MFQPGLLAGKRILVTGGGTGLGKAIGRRYLDLGAELIICGRRIEPLEATAAEHRAQTGGRVSSFQCDVRDAGSVERMFDAVWQEGPLDVLVNNAAGNFIARTERLSSRAVDAVLGIVLHGSMNCTLACGRRWIKGGYAGTVLSIGTQSAWTGHAFTVPSAAAKAGVLAMTQSLAVEWGPRGIRLVVVVPGYFPTPGQMERLHPPGSYEEPLENIVPLGRFGRYPELANLCSYLISPQADYINGACITIDGGKWLGETHDPNWRGMQDWTDAQWAASRQ